MSLPAAQVFSQFTSQEALFLQEFSGLEWVAGDIFYIDGSGDPQRLSKGADGQGLVLVSGLPAWSTPAGGGDVVGPASSTDENIAVFNLTTGKAIKDGGYTIAEVLDADNHTSGTTNKVFTATEQTKLGYISVTQAVDLDQMETDIAALANGMVYKGDWDASAGTFPGAGSAQTGWFYYVSVAGTVDSVDFAVGDNIVATTDNASTTTYASNWSKHDQTDAVQAVAGLTGSISKPALLSALNVEDGADVTDATNVSAAGASIISSGAGAPGTTPSKVGNIYIDTTNDNSYIAVGTASSADWKNTEDAGGSFEPHYIYVAATDATTREKAVADYQCDGTADEVQINLAIDDVRAVGGQVVLSSGNFAIAASIDMDGTTAEGGDNPEVRLIGSGIDSTFLNGASNIDVIEAGQRAKYEMAYFTIAVAGTGDGIHQTAGTERGNWQSHIHDIFIKSDFTSHTGWGIDMESPFRMRFTNIEMNGVANGMNLQSHSNSFNPGNISIDRIFIDLWNDASNSSAIGFKLAVVDSSATGVFNLVTVNRLDIYGGSNLTSSIGISIVGSTSSYGDSRHHSFTNLNIEDVATAIKHVRGRDCTYRDLNYVRVLGSGKIIDLDSNSHNNFFENLYAVGTTSTTFDLITDANSSTNLPNSLKRVDGYQPSSVTINATLASNTILEQIDLSGGSPTIDSDITNRNNVRYFAGIELGNLTDTTITRSSAGVVAVEGQTLMGYLLTSEASSATPTITGTALRNDYVATALATNCTLGAPSGTANANAMLRYRLTATGTYTVGYNAGLLAGNITRTTSLDSGETLTQLYQRVDSTWVCVFDEVTS